MSVPANNPTWTPWDPLPAGITEEPQEPDEAHTDFTGPWLTFVEEMRSLVESDDEGREWPGRGEVRVETTH